jgi:RNA polymerase sigma-70 factor (ECF subfamily)
MRPSPHTPSTRSELDEVTLHRARRGEAGAFRSLVLCYQGAVASFLWRMGGARATRAWAEDLAQETFLRVYRGLPGFRSDGPARLSTWILTIATHVALKDLRRLRLPFVPLGRRDAASEERADAGAERRALGRLLARALGRLSPEHRAVFLLREAHELTLEEVARALAIEVGTVKSRLSRAKAALRAALEGSGA